MTNIPNNELTYSRKYLNDINIVLSKLDGSSKDSVAIMLQTHLIITFVAEISNIINEQWYPKYFKNISHVHKYFQDKEVIGKVSLIDTIVLICGYNHTKEILKCKEYGCVKEWLKERNPVAHRLGYEPKSIQDFIKPRPNCDNSIIDMAEKLLNTIELKLNSNSVSNNH